MIEVRPFKLEDCYTIAETHMKYLTTSFKGQPGFQLLSIYYEVIASRKGGTGLIVIKDDEFAGFICGVWDWSEIRESLIKKWDRLIVHGIKHVIQDPMLIPGFLNRIINIHTLPSEKVKGYEVRPIVVLPNFRSQGLGDKLMLQLLLDARQRGFNEVFLVTYADNFAAIKFYTKFGFVPAGKFNKARKTVKLFRYPLEDSAYNNL